MEPEIRKAVFELVEFVTKMELTNTSKQLIISYYEQAEGLAKVERARQAVLRYTQCGSLPSLSELRQKNRQSLTKLDHLVLKLEYAALQNQT